MVNSSGRKTGTSSKNNMIWSILEKNAGPHATTGTGGANRVQCDRSVFKQTNYHTHPKTAQDANTTMLSLNDLQNCSSFHRLNGHSFQANPLCRLNIERFHGTRACEHNQTKHTYPRRIAMILKRLLGCNSHRVVVAITGSRIVHRLNAPTVGTHAKQNPASSARGMKALDTWLCTMLTRGGWLEGSNNTEI